MNGASPEALLEAAQTGDRASLERLLFLHRQGVYRYGLKVCRTTEDTEDAVQEALWAATRAIKGFRGSAAHFARWLFTIVRHECFRLLERRRPRPQGDAGDQEAIEPIDRALPPDDEVAMRQRGELLAAALAVIEPTHREVLLLRDIQGMSAPEAASALGISVDALKSRLHRARTCLRDEVLRRSPTE